MFWKKKVVEPKLFMIQHRFTKDGKLETFDAQDLKGREVEEFRRWMESPAWPTAKRLIMKMVFDIMESNMSRPSDTLRGEGLGMLRAMGRLEEVYLSLKGDSEDDD